jgi:hypothetical protein
VVAAIGATLPSFLLAEMAAVALGSHEKE